MHGIHKNIILCPINSSEFQSIYNDGIFDTIDIHPFYGAFGRAYYPAIHGNNARDVSFMVIFNGRPILYSPCSIINRSLDWYGLPIEFFYSIKSSASEIKKAQKIAVDHICSLISYYNIGFAQINEVGMHDRISQTGESCFSQKWHAKICFHGRSNLERDISSIKQDIRKSYRSLINWGEKNITIEYVNSHNQSSELYNEFREFHKLISGRSTRSLASWNVAFEWIKNGMGELTIGRLADGNIVAATLIVDGTSISSYATGVYDRSKFDMPIAHFPLYLSIIRSRARDMKIFDLAELYQARDVEHKVNNISYFKRGFAEKIVPIINWTWGSL
jgi:hypothetical protein